MTTTKNNEHKKLNFSSEREQSQVCLNSAEHEKNQGRKVLNVPNLRFKEFEGEWEMRKFKDVCSTSTGNKNTQDKIDDGIYPFYVRSQTVERINSWTFDGEAILTAGDGVGVGKVFHHTYGKIGVHQRVYILSNFKCDANYLFHFFSSNFYNRVKRMSAKNSVDSVRKEMITEMPLYLPSEQEQTKIGVLLSLLDERIATQNKIIEDLKKLKSAIIDYAINSLNTDFAKFGSLYEMAGEGGTPTTSNANFYDNGKIPFIKIDDLKQKYLTENKDFITELGLQKSSAWLVPTHSILFSNGATIGDISITTYPVCTKQGILGIVPKQNIDVEFLYYFMSSSYFKKAVSRIVTEGTMKTAYLKDINNILCPIPTKEKQQEIAKMPSALNSKIDFEQSILKLFCSQKQHLLRQMFI